MRDIDLGPVDRPDRPERPERPIQVAPEPDVPATAGPDLLSFGGEPGGGDENRDRWIAWAWRLRWLPERWRRPVPRGVVAAVSAVLAGAAVAVYLDRPADETPRPPPEPARLLAPESWLDVREGGFPPPVDEIGVEGPRWDEAVAQHPPDALLVLPLGTYQPRLLGLPPGSYQVWASCELTEVPESFPEPVRFGVNVRELADFSATTPELSCDGEPRIIHERLEVTGYQAYYAEFYFIFGEIAPDDGDPYYELEQSGPMVVVSVTPA